MSESSLKELVLSDIADFFAGLDQPFSPSSAEEQFYELSKRMKSIFAKYEDKHNIEQRIVGMEMVAERFCDIGAKIPRTFEISTEQIYDYCDEIYGGDSQHIRGKFN